MLPSRQAPELGRSRKRGLAVEGHVTPIAQLTRPNVQRTPALEVPGELYYFVQMTTKQTRAAISRDHWAIEPAVQPDAQDVVAHPVVHVEGIAIDVDGVDRDFAEIDIERLTTGVARRQQFLIFGLSGR
jgi:hypothetical protein